MIILRSFFHSNTHFPRWHDLYTPTLVHTLRTPTLDSINLIVVAVRYLNWSTLIPNYAIRSTTEICQCVCVFALFWVSCDNRWGTHSTSENCHTLLVCVIHRCCRNSITNWCCVFASAPFLLQFFYTLLICASDATFIHALLKKQLKKLKTTRKKAQQTLIASFSRDIQCHR